MTKKKNYILWFNEITMEQVNLVGGKNTSLGMLYTAFKKNGIKVPNGFAITSHAFRDILKNSEVDIFIKNQLKELKPSNIEKLQIVGRIIREKILSIDIPLELIKEIADAYKDLCAEYGNNVDVAVRSSATLEDLEDASFAGQQDTYLNVRGIKEVIDKFKHCLASLYTDRAISYRTDRGFDDLDVSISVGVQKMVRSDMACSGIMFTIDTESGFKDVVIINASYGLGESIVEGGINPDEYIVYKNRGFSPIIKRQIGSKENKKIYATGNKTGIMSVPVNENDRDRFVLQDHEIHHLVNIACNIEKLYGRPMDIEWAKDGITEEFFIVQARPETVCSNKQKNVEERFVLKKKGKVLIQGQAIGQKIGTGKVKLIEKFSNIMDFQQGDILVTDMTTPSWEPIMKIAGGIVTNKGSRTCHTAIVGRELGLPVIVGTENATKILNDGQKITVCCAEGHVGNVYDKILDYEIETQNVDNLTVPENTKIMLNLGSPGEAFRYSKYPNAGVGLARIEFIITNAIKTHPNALIHFDELDIDTKDKITKVTKGYDDKKKCYIDKLAEGVAQIAAPFYPKDVIVRMSDFKSNEYEDLIGGHLYEKSESNPMIGFRGASRYLHPDFYEAFALECMAMNKVRNEMGFKNVKLMIPFCRTIEEGKKVIDLMRNFGLRQGENGLEIYMMVELPSNVILLDQFADIFDGFSIGSNDLTQLILGLDRDSEKVANLFDETNQAVKIMIKDAIVKAKRKGKKIGICGQAPSDYPEFSEFLIECGIDSISLNPDTVIKSTKRIVEYEKSKRLNISTDCYHDRKKEAA